MPRRCCIPGCNSNYDSVLKRGEKAVSTFKIPNAEPQRSPWLKAIPRDDWEEEQKTAAVCIRHFDKRFICRNKENGKPSIAKTGYPSIFPNCPNYLQIQLPEKRTSPTKRKARIAENHEIAVKKFLDADIIKNFDDFRSNLSKIEEMRTWKMVINENEVCFFL